MRKRVRRVPANLDSKGIRTLPLSEIKAILRGADPLIRRGGRSLLAKILKGSRDKDVLERKLDECPVYGYFSNLSLSDITAKIDWVILQDYLVIEYDYRLPLLVFSEKGWGIEKHTYSDELLNRFEEMIESGSSEFDLLHMKDRPRDLVFQLLDKIKAKKDPRFIPLLESWEKVDYKKVRARIHEVIRSISSQSRVP